jgi:hypothetical protein
MQSAMSTSRKKIGGTIFLVITVGASIVFSAFGDRMNRDQLFGCLVIWVFFVIWALFAFWFGGLPFFLRRFEDPSLKIPCAVAVISLAFAILQIPIWSLMTRQFPPDHFSSIQALLVTAGVVFSLFGPAAPFVFVLARQIWQVNQEQHRVLKEKKNKL